ncbi:MAG: insulinase family protein [Bacteroidetes bacterium]|nr:MAG: insulinase family protein [Bacteroidota bacterium]
MRILIAFMLCLILGTSFSSAQKKAPLPVTTSITGTNDSIQFKYDSFPGDPLNTRRYVLNNGLTVYFSLNKRAPKVQAMVAVRAGSKDDPSDNTGLAHYLEHMLFKGTNNFGTRNYVPEMPLLKRIEELYEIYRNLEDTAARKLIYARIDSISYRASKFAIANEYDKMMQILGASGTNAYTSFDQTVYINEVPSNQIYKWIEIEAERFRAPVFRLFHTELEAVYEEKNRSLDNDDSKAFEKLFEGIFFGHPYGMQTTIGTVEHLKNPSLKAIQAYYRSNYVPSNMALVLSGDINADSLIYVIDREFSKIPYSPAPVKQVWPDKIIRPFHSAEVYGPNPAYVMFGYKTPSGRVMQSATHEVFNSLLYNGKAGLLDKNLNLNQKVQSASSFNYPLHDAGCQIFVGVPKANQTPEQVKDLILAEIEKIKKGDFDASLIEAVVNNKEAELLQSYKDNYSRASEIVDAFILGYSWKDYQTVLNGYKSVTKEDIVKFANTYFTDESLMVVYKREGTDTSIQKIEKPKITPVELNKESESMWLKTHAYQSVSPIEPKFLNYSQDLTQKKTANGLDLFYIKNQENGLFSLYYVLEMGSRNDLKTAFAIDLLPYLGTDKYSVDELNKKFYQLAADFGVTATSDRIYVYLNGINKNFDASLELFEHLLRNVKPNQEALDQLVERTLKDRADAKKNKRTILRGALQNYALYGKENPFTYRLSEEELKGLKADDMTSLIKGILNYQHYIFYFGPQSVEDISKKIETQHQVADSLQAYPTAKEFEHRESPKKNTVYFVDYDMVQSEILWLRNAGEYDMALEPESALFNEYFGGGMGTVVFQELRESKALAYSTYAVFSTASRPKTPNYVLAYIGTQSDKMNEAVPAMNTLLNTLPKDEDAIRKAKIGLKQQLETNRTLEESIFFSYLSAKRMGRETDLDAYIYDNLDKMDLNTVIQFQQTYLANQNYYYCIIASKDRVKMDDLKKFGELKVLTLEEIFGY